MNVQTCGLSHPLY